MDLKWPWTADTHCMAAMQYKLFVGIRQRFSENCRQTGVGWLKLTNLQFSRCYIFVASRNNVGINCTLRQHPVLDSCRHQYGWPWMTLNARFNLNFAWLTYVVAFRANQWPCVTECTWTLAAATKMCPMNCSFRACEDCMNFSGYLLQCRKATNQEWSR